VELGGVATDRYAVGTNFDALVFASGAVSSWGTGLFAYLRHDDTGSIIGTIDPVTHIVTDRVDLGTNFLSALTFTATSVGYGPNLFYYLRPEGSTLTTNIVTTFTTNTLTTFTTNTVTTYMTNSVVSFTPTNTVAATGMDTCQARVVTAAANCLGPVALSDQLGSGAVDDLILAPQLSESDIRKQRVRVEDAHDKFFAEYRRHCRKAQLRVGGAARNRDCAAALRIPLRRREGLAGRQ